MANLELLDHPKPPSFPSDWPLAVRVHDDWTVFSGQSSEPPAFFNETHGLLLLADESAEQLVAALREWGAKIAVAQAADSPYIYQIVRVAESHAAQIHGNSVLDISLAKEHGRRQRVRAAVQTGLATGAAFAGAVLRSEHLPGIDFGRLDLSEVVMSNSNLDGTDFRGARLSDANLRGANASGARFEHVDARRADFSHMQATGCFFHGADLELASFANASVSSADLSMTRLVRADLRNADLRGVDLSNAALEYANLSGANLRESNLSRAILTGAILAQADLTGAQLDGAELLGADMDNAVGIANDGTQAS